MQSESLLVRKVMYEKLKWNTSQRLNFITFLLLRKCFQFFPELISIGSETAGRNITYTRPIKSLRLCLRFINTVYV